ncbi:MAG: DUF547 domain-containing protein [Cyanobacteria bacterium SID2]|nr:DUF547 domain-containing protein [Cyanobacteria bacterium SID2]MBP0006712.1 DUF547 domain-containing protein [Cyanobacteria bacterium SBC]
MRREYYSILLASTLLFASGCAIEAQVPYGEDVSIEEVSKVARGEPFTYEDYETVLSAYVTEDGLVDYASLKANREILDRFHADLAALPKEVYEGWTESEKIAFWVNIYNSLTLQAIIDNYPVDSIRDIPGVWKRLQFTVMGEGMTLDTIEHGILRREFNEPRIHMALVCASIGCPLLRTEPFTGDRLDEQLDEQTRVFLGFDRNFQIDLDRNEVLLSSIFQWFGEDFEATYGTSDKFEGHNDKARAVLNFVSQYVNDDDLSYLKQVEYRLKYLDYDWGLNALTHRQS